MADTTFGQGEAGANAFPDPDSLTYEQARAELIETVKILELGQMSLDESLRYWERGEALAKRCELLLQGAAQQVEAVIGHRSEADPSNSNEQTDADNESV